MHHLKVFNGPMTLSTFEQTKYKPESEACSPFVDSPTASTRLAQADSSFVEVPGCINGVISSQCIGYGRYSVR